MRLKVMFSRAVITSEGSDWTIRVDIWQKYDGIGKKWFFRMNQLPRLLLWDLALRESA